MVVQVWRKNAFRVLLEGYEEHVEGEAMVDTKTFHSAVEVRENGC